MNKPTFGPWFVGAQNDGLYVIDRPPRPSNDDINPDADVEVIAKVYRPADGRHETEMARARLIAAAPDLLEASKELDGLDCCEGYTFPESDWPRLWKALGLARAAVAKAEGKATD
jgi:hypothetical protein